MSTSSTQQPASDEWVADYERNGYHFPIPVMSTQQAQLYRQQLEAVERSLAGDHEKRKLAIGHANAVLPFVDELTRLPMVLDAVSAVLGPNLLVWNASFFIKEPNTRDFISWHQDLTYWGLSESHETTAWIALSSSTIQSGCVKFVPGSHRQNIVEHRDTFHEDNLLSRGQEIAVEVDEEDAVSVELRPGEMSLHHGQVFHGSHANRSDDRRIGLAIRYITPEMKQASGDKTNARLVSGVDEHQHFNLTAPPTGILQASDVEAVQRNIALSAKFLFDGVEKPSD